MTNFLLTIELTPALAETIETVWWIGLAAALVLTLIDVLLLVRVIKAAKKIEHLAERTLPAAVGIVKNTAALKNLAATNEVAEALIEKALPIVRVADSIEKKLAAVALHFGGRKGGEA